MPSIGMPTSNLQQAVKPQFVEVMPEELQAAKVLARRLVESYAGVSHG